MVRVLFASLVGLSASVAVAAEPELQVVAEVGRDSRETRWYSACAAKLQRNAAPMLVVGGFTNPGSGEMSDVSVYDLSGAAARLQWRTSWSGAKHSLLRTVRAADLDGDGVDELVVLGRVGEHTNHRNPEDGDNAEAQIKVFGVTKGVLAPLAEVRWQSGIYTHGFGMDVGDIDGDHRPEVVSGGFFSDGVRTHELSQLSVWRLWNGSLQLVDRAQWGSHGKTRINAVAIGDVEGDGQADIITAGRTEQHKDEAYDKTLSEKAELTAWQFREGKLVRRAGYQWEKQGLARLREVQMADLDGNGVQEIIGVGRSESEQKPYICIATLSGESLALRSDTGFAEQLGEVRDIAAYKTSDGLRLVTVSAYGVKPDRQGQLRIWRFGGDKLELVHDRSAVQGDETRVRDLVMWPGSQGLELVSVGFVRQGERNLGQILNWGVVPQ